MKIKTSRALITDARKRGKKMFEKYKAYYVSEIGTIEIVGTGSDILSVNFLDDPANDLVKVPECMEPCVTQLNEYFQGKRKEFSLPFQLHGTDFEKKVWKALLDIPYGSTQAYSDIADKIGHKKASRAVGNANRKNNIAIIIPCHRVIGSNGSLTGYACGIWRKKWLLEHEKKHLNLSL